MLIRTPLNVPGKPVAYNNGLLSINYGLLWGIVACNFRLLGVPCTLKAATETSSQGSFCIPPCPGLDT